MRYGHMFFVSIVLALAAQPEAFAQGTLTPCKTPPKVGAATVFPAGALMTRPVPLAIAPAKTAEMEFDLPLAADANHLEFLVSDGGRLETTFTVATTQCSIDTSASDKDRKAAEAALKQATAEEARIKADVDATNQVLDNLNAIRSKFIANVATKAQTSKWPLEKNPANPAEGLTPDLAAGAIDDIWSAFHVDGTPWKKLEGRIRDSHSAQQTAHLAATEATKAANAALQQIVAKSSVVRPVNRVTLRTTAPDGFNGTLYVVNSTAEAGWKPEYLTYFTPCPAPRVSAVCASVNVRAKIWQDTGEDWSGVMVSVSRTATKDRLAGSWGFTSSNPVSVPEGEGGALVDVASISSGPDAVLELRTDIGPNLYLETGLRPAQLATYDPGGVRTFWNGAPVAKTDNALPWTSAGKRVLIGPVPGFKATLDDYVPEALAGGPGLNGSRRGTRVEIEAENMAETSVRIVAQVPRLVSRFYRLEKLDDLVEAKPFGNTGAVYWTRDLRKGEKSTVNYGYSVSMPERPRYAW